MKGGTIHEELAHLLSDISERAKFNLAMEYLSTFTLTQCWSRPYITSSDF